MNCLNYSKLYMHAAYSAVLFMTMLNISITSVADENDKDKESKRYSIIIKDDWNESRESVKNILSSVADTMMKQFPEVKLKPMMVYPKGGPIVLYKRGPKGEYTIKLNTGNGYWSQYVFQYAHEICHVLCQYDTDPHSHDWFEESICEVASIYTLRQLSKTWLKSKNRSWRNFAKSHGTYAANRIKIGALPEGQTFAVWYESNIKQLRKSATQRELNQVVAVQLLPLFEKYPEQWASVHYLNAAKVDGPISFEVYLKNWLKHAPEKHHSFIRLVAFQFKIKI